MEKNSYSTKILRYLYFKKEKTSSKEIALKTKIPIKQITPHTNKMVGRGLIKREVINHTGFYLIPKWNIEAVRRTLEKAEALDEN